MTFNVGNGLADPSRLAAVLLRTAPDIVGLQELAVPQADTLAMVLADAYPYQVLVPDGFSGKGLLSRFPVVFHEPLLLHAGRPDLRVLVDVGGMRMSVLVVHPPPPRLQRGLITFGPATVAQLERLAELAAEHTPSAMLGDFNMTRRNLRYARLVAGGWQDAFAVAGEGRGWTLPVRLGYASSFNHRLQALRLRPVARVDYIWYTPPLQAEAAWVGPDAGSDHLPVLARMTLSAA